MGEKEFWVECNVCKHRLKNWVGSTPCCGSIAWVIEDGKVTDKVKLYIEKHSSIENRFYDNSNK